MIGAMTVARPYAKAAFDIACQDDALAVWTEALAKLVLIVAHPSVILFLQNPCVDVHTTIDFLQDIVAADDEHVNQFIDVLAQAKRLIVLPQIQRIFAQLDAERAKQIHVEITTSEKLTPAQTQLLQKKLEQRLDRHVLLTEKQDDHLLGGAVLRVNHSVIDSSGIGYLAQLAHSLKGNSL
jgi:F-type H+-transporting ATPase subunit delta